MTLAIHPELAEALRAIVRDEVQPLRAEVVRLRTELANARCDSESAGPRLLSARQAAKLLGVSATQTLAPAIREGRVRTVKLPGTRRSVRIPADEVERIAREGLLPAPKVSRLPPPKRPSGAELARECAAMLKAERAA